MWLFASQVSADYYITFASITITIANITIAIASITTQGCQFGLMKLVENKMCHCIVALCILREWQKLQNCSTTTSPIGGTTFSTQCRH